MADTDRCQKVVWVSLRVGVEVNHSGYPETAGRLAEMEAKCFVEELTATADLNKTSRLVKDAKVASVAVWEAEAH